MFSRIINKAAYSSVRLNTSIFWRNLGLRFNSTVKHASPPKPATGIKKLIQTYGYSALGVYLGVSLIDLPICYVIVHSAGEEKIRELQDQMFDWIGSKKDSDEKIDKSVEISENKNSDESDKKSSTFLTEFAVAYALHKSLVFIRLPITAAITPWVVSRLQKMGFKIGTAAISQIKNAANATKGSKKFDPTGKSARMD